MSNVDKIKLLLATGFGTGYAPIASGTFGTLVGIPIVWIMSGVHPWFYMAATALVYFVGVKCADFGEEYFKKKDAGQIVIDEVVGYMATMFLVPVTLTTLITGFFVFRFFDIVKPPPARQIDQAEMGGQGVMLDDLAAGIYGCILMHLIF